MAEPVAYRLWVQDFRDRRISMGDPLPEIIKTDFKTREEANAARALFPSHPDVLLTVTPVFPKRARVRRYSETMLPA